LSLPIKQYVVAKKLGKVLAHKEPRTSRRMLSVVASPSPSPSPSTPTSASLMGVKSSLVDLFEQHKHCESPTCPLPTPAQQVRISTNVGRVEGEGNMHKERSRLRQRGSGVAEVDEQAA